MYVVHQMFQNSHWWFTARRLIVMSALRHMIGRDPNLTPPLRLFDIGCGAGGMLPWLSELGTAIGIDPSEEAARYAQQNGYTIRQGCLPDNLERTRDEPAADIVLLLDVLEHIDDDARALASVHRFLRPGGGLIITVPAFQFLWSGHDVVNEHYRRYSRRQLADRLTDAGFHIEGLSYYNTMLFPAIAAARLFGRLMPEPSARPDMSTVPAPLNQLLHWIFATERYIVPEVSLPFGVSLIATAHSA